MTTQEYADLRHRLLNGTSTRADEVKLVEYCDELLARDSMSVEAEVVKLRDQIKKSYEAAIGLKEAFCLKQEKALTFARTKLDPLANVILDKILGEIEEEMT